MGELVNGQWHTGPVATSGSDGAFNRKPSVFRDTVTADGAPVDGKPTYKAEAGRYHLYVSLACPWAHRTLIMRALKGLEEMVGLSVVNFLMLDEGWTFDPAPGVIPDSVNGAQRLYEVYVKADPHCNSRVTVPVLWDKARGTIISNESAEIIRMFNSAFDGLGAAPGDYYPAARRDEIDAINARVYDTLNNGVYRAGFAKKQGAYETAAGEVFETLEWLEGLLEGRAYLTGDTMSEADIRLFTTLVRFDPVYHGHFKCNVRRIVDYPNLWRFTRRMVQDSRIRPTIDMDHIKGHYYRSHTFINPTGIVPIGPDIDYDAPLD